MLPVSTPPPSSDAATELRHSENRGPLAQGQGFGHRYHIVRLLGSGGMGAVYQAWDAELGIAVALKVILPESADDPATAQELEARFKRELLLARQVTHKNVVRIHDIGEIEGIKYLTMTYVEGADLASLLKKQEKLPAARALRVVRQVVSGLHAAHEAGVVHRDLKPANIMIDDTEDEALIMDFGIARSSGGRTAERGSGSLALNEAPDQAAVNLGETMRGAVVGTLQYMAPELAQGSEAGPQSDIYALGLIFYDMLVGPRRSEKTPSPMAELTARMKSAPPPARSIDAGIPESLSAVIARCLDPDPAARYQSTGELAANLERLDDEGIPLPMTRRLSLWQVAALLGVVVASLVSVWWFSSPTGPPVEPDPVSVLIADFQNDTSDPTFDRTLEPMLKFALEDADFITAYGRAELSRGLGVQPPENLDDVAAREIAVNHGLGVVLFGSVEHEDSGYRLSVTATQAVTGDVIASADDRASDKNEVLAVAANLARDVREALGDDTSDSAQRFAMETLSATTLDVVHEYAEAMLALSDSRFENALQGFAKAVELDPEFGLAYAGMAIASRNLDRQEDAEKYVGEALRHLDGMTQRERYRTRGLFYMVTGDHPACVKEYGDLIARYEADAAARNNLALCSTYLRDLPRALDEMRRVVEILPNRALYRENLALYASYGGDFEAAEQEARAMEEPGLFGLLALAFAQLGQGQLDRATQTYQEMESIDAQGVSYAASGLGDLALYEGRLSEAARIFEQGAIADVAAGDIYRGAAKFTALAHTQLLRQQRARAIAAAENALANSQAVKIRFLAARVFVEAGESDRAQSLAAGLASELQAEPQAYAKIVEGEAALNNGDARGAIDTLTEANGLLDTWMGHFVLGRAYLEAEAYPQADSEFDRCIARRGEAVSLFLDEEPTYGYFPRVYYYQGRAREGLNSIGSTEPYRTYLDIRGAAAEDPLLPEVRRRAGQ